jgi:hypothetical protein
MSEKIIVEFYLWDQARQARRDEMLTKDIVELPLGLVPNIGDEVRLGDFEEYHGSPGLFRVRSRLVRLHSQSQVRSVTVVLDLLSGRE